MVMNAEPMYDIAAIGKGKVVFMIWCWFVVASQNTLTEINKNNEKYNCNIFGFSNVKGGHR